MALGGIITEDVLDRSPNPLAVRNYAILKPAEDYEVTLIELDTTK